MKRILQYAFLGVAVLVIGAQFVPYGHEHTNPPVKAEPKWDSPGTRQLFYRACKDCHSNETTFPWYSNVAPVSWFLQDHIEEGRSRFNVSEWGRKRNKGGDAAEELESGGMPLQSYLFLHPEAKLSDQEKRQLVDGLRATFGGNKEGVSK